MEQYYITGMSCDACRVRIEKAVRAVDGVDACAVSLLTGTMGVTGSASKESIVAAVVAAGYGAELQTNFEGGNVRRDKESLHIDSGIAKMKKRLLFSAVILIPLLYVSIGYMMWGWPVPPFLDKNYIAIGVYELILSGMVLVINKKYFINGYRGLVHKSPNMDTLVALGALASYIYSVGSLVALSKSVYENNANGISYYSGQFYFESTAMILTLITVGKTLEAKSKGKTTDALKALMDLSPKSAVILDGETEKIVPIEEVKVGDCFVVKPGASIPVDGVVMKGESAVDESALSGESTPVNKKATDAVSAATINTSGYMICRAERVGEDTTLAGIIRMVSDAAMTKAPMSKLADTVSGIFVPIVIAISLITFIVWMCLVRNVGYAVSRAVCVLVISCPCALGLATPVAIMVGNGLGAKSGILFKTAQALEQTGRAQVVVFDKTGTITEGKMKVTDVICADGYDKKDVLEVAYALEAESEHPISKAVVLYAQTNGIDKHEVTEFSIVSGNGLKAKMGTSLILGGNAEYVFGNIKTPEDDFLGMADELSEQGKTVVFFSKGDELAGAVAVADTIKEDSAKAIGQLRKMGIRVVMLTGDNEITARTIANCAGVDEVVASVKPDGKALEIKSLMQKAKVIMVGDGINDAPALTCADVGIAIGAGTDIAIDAADVVLMKDSISDVVSAIKISKATIRVIKQNLFWAFFYNAICIPLAAGCYVSSFGWSLNPMVGAAAMGLSSFCVVSNALRLNRLKTHSVKGDKTDTINSDNHLNDKIEKSMEYTEREEKRNMKITVKGMMCPHCEAHVKKALEAIEGIECAEPSFEENLVTITEIAKVDEKLIKAAVEEAGYEYCGIA